MSNNYIKIPKVKCFTEGCVRLIKKKPNYGNSVCFKCFDS